MNRKKIAIDTNLPSLEPTRAKLVSYLAELDRADLNAANREQKKHTEAERASAAKPGVNWAALFESGLSQWWHEHPARSTALLAKTGIEDFTRRKPIQAVSVAAVTGAALVLLRPWRVVSTAALATTLLRSSKFNGVVGSILETAVQTGHREKA